MTVFLTLEEALLITTAAMGSAPHFRDYGLLQSALSRPQTQLFGEDVYPELDHKAAALLQSLVGNHRLVDGNKRMGFACMAVFLAMNGAPLRLTEDQAYQLTVDVTASRLDDLPEIARRIRSDSDG